MGAVYSLFPSGYVEPAKTTTVDQIVNMSMDEQASFASQSVIMRADDSEFIKKLLEMPAPEPVTAEYLATLAAVVKAGGEHVDALREKYSAAAGKPLADEQKDSVANSDAQNSDAQNSNANSSAPIDTTPVQETPKRVDVVVIEKIVERYVNVHYCPNCGKVYRGSEDDEDDSSESDSTLSNTLD